jgi:hypothetical protein
LLVAAVIVTLRQKQFDWYVSKEDKEKIWKESQAVPVIAGPEGHVK